MKAQKFSCIIETRYSRLAICSTGLAEESFAEPWWVYESSWKEEKLECAPLLVPSSLAADGFERAGRRSPTRVLPPVSGTL